MAELLLELLSEEIPARMQRRAIGDFSELIWKKLQAAELSPSEMRAHVTPRRMVVIVDGITATQPDLTEERRGPRLGAPQPAIDGFLRAAGLASIEQCEVRDTGRGEFYFAVIGRSGRGAAEVLPELIYAAMAELPWPKSMRHPATPLRWVRPLNSVICLFDGEVLPLPLGAIPVGRTTRGHRFLSPGEFAVADGADYLAKLEQAHVVLEQDRRKEIIAGEMDRLAAAAGLTVKQDPALLEEVTGLVEYPVVLMGSIDPDFVRPLPDGLPPEVLATAMRTHQKYFSCLHPDGSPAPRFLCVANNRTPDDGKTIVAGNERVLRARLADARFFWDQDRKIRLEDRVEALKQRVYHEKLGSVYDKVERMEVLAGFLAKNIRVAPALSSVAPAKAGAQGQPAQPALLDSRFRGNDDEGPDEGLMLRAHRAARLAKADLSTGMVGEFPELQGVMGRYYALNDGEDSRVADAIADHYKPLGPNDICPNEPESIIVALADKIDALVTFFAISLPPTGSSDPFALRRAAQGVIRIILENGLRFSLKDAFTVSAERFYRQQIGRRGWESRIAPLYAELLSFLVDRLKVHLRAQGVRYDLIAAAFAQIGVAESDLVRLLARVGALQAFLDTEDGANLLTAYRRASNIVAIEQRRDGQQYEGDCDADLLVQPEEKALVRRLHVIGTAAQETLLREKFEDTMAELASLRRPVDAFFDKVTVNADDPELRANRLRLLSRIRATMNRVADFSQIEG